MNTENQYENLKNIPAIYDILPETNNYKDENMIQDLVFYNLSKKYNV